MGGHADGALEGLVQHLAQRRVRVHLHSQPNHRHHLIMMDLRHHPDHQLFYHPSRLMTVAERGVRAHLQWQRWMVSYRGTSLILKRPHPGTLQQAYAEGLMVVLWGGAVSYERGAPVPAS